MFQGSYSIAFRFGSQLWEFRFGSQNQFRVCRDHQGSDGHGDPFFSCLELGFYTAISGAAGDKVSEQDFCMYFSNLYLEVWDPHRQRRGVCYHLFFRSALLVRNSFLFLYYTNLAMVGRAFSLFLPFCSCRCTLCISLAWRSIWSSSAVEKEKKSETWSKLGSFAITVNCDFAWAFPNT